MIRRTRLPLPLLLGGVGGLLLVQILPFLLRAVFAIVGMIVSVVMFIIGIASRLALPAAVFFLFRYLLSPREGEAGRPAQIAEPRPRQPSRSVAAARGTGEVFPEVAARQAAMAGPDDLKRIEGIGPAIARILEENGIRTFRDLAGASQNRLDEILVKANLRRIAAPDTWPEQARLAAMGDWEGLQRYQDRLKAGRRSN